MLTLAIWDLAHVISAFFAYNFQVLLYIENLPFGYYVKFLPFLYYACCMTRFGSIWTVMALALHKYIAMCHPFKFQTWTEKARCKWMVGIIAFGAAVLSLPRFFESRILWCSEFGSNESVSFIGPSPFRQHMLYWLMYRYTIISYISIYH